MKCNFSGFTFTGSDNKTYGYDSNGAPCTTPQIDINIPNPGSTGNPFTNWTPSPGNFSSGGGVGGTSSPSPFFTPPSIHVPSITSGGSGGSSSSNIVPQQVTNVVTTLVKIHGGQPGLLGYNPEIPQYARGIGGVSMQANGLINDLNYQLNVSGFKDPKGLALPHCDLRDVDMALMVQSLKPFQWNLTVIDFSNNGQLGDTAIENLFYTIGTHQVPAKFVQSFNLSNCNIGDYGAEYIAESLKSGRYPATKSIDLSGNNITATGDTKLVQALKGKVQDMVIITQRLEQNSKLLPGIGTKEEKIALYKEFIQKGVEKGTNGQGIVVDQSLWNNFKTQVQVGKHGVMGFIKCNWEPEGVAKGYAQDKITAKISKAFSKILGKATSIEAVVTCYLETTDTAWTSPEGQKLFQQELCVMGESEFCGE